MSKKRSDSKLNALPINQQEALEEWLFVENLSYKDAQERVYQDFGLRCSQSALSDFYQDRQQSRLLERIALSGQAANSVVERFKAAPAEIYSATMNLVGQMAFEQSMKGDKVDVDQLFDLTRLMIAGRDRELKTAQLGLDTRKVQLLEKKAAQADEAKGAMENGKLSPQERDAKLKEIFGIA